MDCGRKDERDPRSSWRTSRHRSGSIISLSRRCTLNSTAALCSHCELVHQPAGGFQPADVKNTQIHRSHCYKASGLTIVHSAARPPMPLIQLTTLTSVTPLISHRETPELVALSVLECIGGSVSPIPAVRVSAVTVKRFIPSLLVWYVSRHQGFQPCWLSSAVLGFLWLCWLALTALTMIEWASPLTHHSICFSADDVGSKTSPPSSFLPRATSYAYVLR